MPLVKLVIYDTGQQKQVPVKTELLPPKLREKYEPFAGKTVTWKDDKIVETEIKK